VADSGSSPASPLGQSLATDLSAASDSQRAALPALALSGPDAATTAQSLATAADSVPPAAEASASKQIKRNFNETEDAGSAVQCCQRGDGSVRPGTDYQAIPDEEYWRYNRYLDGRSDRWPKYDTYQRTIARSRAPDQRHGSLLRSNDQIIH